ncbi:MAG: CPBP family intramembrane metalloprotease [Gemmatimonadetes bacterium]|nr:CPBP family intramembrane metalloprotease [Gemmatimonadota bacterium]
MKGDPRTIWRLALFAVLFVALSAVFMGLLRPSDEDIAVSGFTLLTAAVLAGWVMLRLEGLSLGDLGFRLHARAAPQFALGLAGGISLVIAWAALAATGGALQVALERPVSGGAGQVAAGALAALWLFASPAAAEEALFRGYPYQLLVRSLGAVPATALAAVAFGLIHLVNPNATWIGALNTGLSGLLLSLVYLRSRSLWSATGLHLGWNFAIAFLVDLPVSGYDLVDTPYLSVALRGPSWLGGGSFGPEGGLIATVVLVTACVLAVRTLLGQAPPHARGESAAVPAPPTST